MVVVVAASEARGDVAGITSERSRAVRAVRVEEEEEEEEEDGGGGVM